MRGLPTPIMEIAYLEFIISKYHFFGGRAEAESPSNSGGQKRRTNPKPKVEGYS